MGIHRTRPTAGPPAPVQERPRRRRRRKRGKALVVAYAIRALLGLAGLLCVVLVFRGTAFLFSLAYAPAEEPDVIQAQTDQPEADGEEQPVQPTARPPVATVVLDAGHGGVQPGCVIDGIQEKDIAFAITMMVKGYLEEENVQVVLTRSTDADISLSERTDIANQVGGACLVSIHCNSFEDSSITGLECFYYKSEENKGLAELLSAATDRGGVVTREVKEGNFQVLRDCQIPSVLVEVGYMTNPDELKLLASEDYQQTLASAIAGGIMDMVEG